MPDQKRLILTLAFCFYAISTLISMAVMSIGAGVLLLAMLWFFAGPAPIFSRIRGGIRSSVSESRYFKASLALALICVASLIAGKLWPLSYSGKIPDIHVLKNSAKLWYLFWPLLLLVGLRELTQQERNKVLLSWIVAFAALSCLGIVQYYIGWPRPQGIPSAEIHRYHATLFLGHHLSVASIFIFPFFACLDFWKRGFQPRFRWALGLVLVLSALMLFFTYSRTLWVALPLSVIVWLLMNLSRRWAASFILVTLLGAALVMQVPSVRSRFRNESFVYGFSTREDLWKANFEFVKQRPVLGVGWKHNQELSGYYLMEKYPGQEVFSGHAHNNILDMLGGTGLAGAGVWLIWNFLVIGFAWQAWRRKISAPAVFASGLFCAWIAFQINGLTQVNFWEAKVTHQVMWMVAWSLLWLKSETA